MCDRPDLCRSAAQHDEELAGLLARAAPLDKFSIPTRYPRGLPGGIPADAFSAADAAGALEMAELVLATVSGKVPAADEEPPAGGPSEPPST